LEQFPEQGLKIGFHPLLHTLIGGKIAVMAFPCAKRKVYINPQLAHMDPLLS